MQGVVNSVLWRYRVQCRGSSADYTARIDRWLAYLTQDPDQSVGGTVEELLIQSYGLVADPAARSRDNSNSSTTTQASAQGGSTTTSKRDGITVFGDVASAVHGTSHTAWSAISHPNQSDISEPPLCETLVHPHGPRPAPDIRNRELDAAHDAPSTHGAKRLSKKKEKKRERGGSDAQPQNRPPHSFAFKRPTRAQHLYANCTTPRTHLQLMPATMGLRSQCPRKPAPSRL